MIPSPLTKDNVVELNQGAPDCGAFFEHNPDGTHIFVDDVIAAVRLAEQKMMTDFDMLGKIKYEGFTLRDEELARSKNEGARREILRCLGKLREAFPVAYDDPKGESNEGTK